MTAATAFATTISLLADFIARRDANRATTLDEFLAWLAEHRHDQIRAMLEQNISTTIAIKALLGESRQQILDRLESLDRTLARFAAGFDSYRELAIAVRPDSILSDQAMSLLDQLNDLGASKFLLVTYLDGTKSLPVVDGRGEDLTFNDPRFLEDDLAVLCEMDFLSSGRNSRGDILYSFRRAGAQFVEKIRGQ